MNTHERTIEPDPDSCAPSKAQIYVGLGWTSEIISKARQELHAIEPRLVVASEAVDKAVEDHRMVGVKLAAEAAYEAAVEAEMLIRSIRDNAAVLARKAAEHLNRRSRV